MDENKVKNENKIETEKEKVEEFDPQNGLTLFFENFIKTGTVVKEKEVLKNFKVKLKVLDTGELLDAQAVLSLTNPGIPADVAIKVRGAAILSRSIISINDIEVESKDLTDEENRLKRHSLYRQLLRTPAIVIQKAYELYIEAVKEQNEFYTGKNLTDNIENF